MASGPSPNDTVITPNIGSITGASSNVWSVTNGQVVVNGVVDPTTANVIEMAYVNGLVWQENASNLWWEKSTPTDTWSPSNGTPLSPLPAPSNTVSANDTALFFSGQTITDANHNSWSISGGGQVLTNGAADATTANVIELAYVNGQVWQENANYLWWAKSLPSDSWSPGNGTTVSPLPPSTNPVSADNTLASAVGQTITDAKGNTWSINPAGQVLENRAADPTTARVTALAYEQGQVWQENADGLWWAKSVPSDTWSPGSGTSVSPIPPGYGATTAPLVTRTWVGGSNVIAANPANWSPAGAPQPGDSLLISTAATINVGGNDLAGDLLTVNTDRAGPAASVNINTFFNAQLNLVDDFSAGVTLSVEDTVTLNLGSIHGGLVGQGGTIQFIGSSGVNGSTVLNNNLTGNATVALAGAQGEGSSMEINGAVGQGLTFVLHASAPVLSLQLDQPGQFAGLLDLGLPGGYFGDVLFKGLQATSGTLANGVLDMFNGNSLIDSVRITGDTARLTLDQTSSGVALSQGHLYSGNLVGTGVIPLTNMS